MLSGLPRITSFATSSHQYFSSQLWPKNPHAISFEEGGKKITPCYHSQVHIEAVMKAAEAIIQAVLSTKQDPLQLTDDFKRWTEQYDISKESRQFLANHMSDVFVLSFACHDLGNITTSSELHKIADSWQLDYSSEFQLGPVVTEQRSSELTMKLINKFLNIQPEFLGELIKLVDYLIMQTVFDPTKPNSNEPFWVAMQVIDQIAGHFFSEMPLYKASAGYLNEIYVSSDRGNRAPVDLNTFINFLPNRLNQLIPNLEQKSQLILILDPLDRKQDYLTVNPHVPGRKVDYERDIEVIYTGKFF